MVVGTIVGAAYLGYDYSERKHDSYISQFIGGMINVAKGENGKPYVAKTSLDDNLDKVLEANSQELVAKLNQKEKEIDARIAKTQAEKVSQKVRH